MRMSIYSLCRSISVTLVAILAMTACSPGDIFDSSEDSKPLPVSHPQATDVASDFTPPVWSGDGALLGYVLPDSRSAVARAGGTGERRVLYSVTAPEFIIRLELSPDGAEWLTVTTDANHRRMTLRWHHGGAVDVLTDSAVRGVTAPPNRQLRAALATANGEIAYVVRPDSLFLRSRATEDSRFVGVGCGGIAAVSPTGAGVICFNREALGPALRYDPGSGGVTAMPSGDLAYEDVRWTAEGVYAVLSSLISHYVWRRHSDPQSTYATPKGGREEERGGFASLSGDGKSFAYANGFCPGGDNNILSCPIYQELIYYADALAKTTRRLAVHMGGPAVVATSPDGARIAYILKGQLYLVNTR